MRAIIIFQINSMGGEIEREIEANKKKDKSWKSC